MTISDREKNLSFAVGAIVFVLLNFMLLSTFARRNTTLRQQLSDRRLQLTQINALLDTRGDWAARDEALTKAQPKLGNENAAGVELLNLIHTLAKKETVTPENEVLGRVTKTTYYRSVAVTVDTHSTWPHLIAFLYSLQGPTNFIVCESANIQVDPADPSKMLGHFRIARWYAP